MHKIFFILLFILFINCPLQTNAVELFESYTSIRALGMGNAYTPIVDDENSLFYNPAGLSRDSSYRWTILNMGGGINDPESLVKAADLVSNNKGLSALVDQKIWIGGGAKTAITTPNFGLAYYDSGAFSIGMNNVAYPHMNVSVINDLGIALGVGANLVPNVYSGMVVRRIKRSGGNAEFGITDISAFTSNMITNLLNTDGIGYGLDLGLTMVVPSPLSPSCAFVWKNIGYTSFKVDTGKIAPPSISDEMIVGCAINFKSLLMNFTPVIEYKYANRTDLQLGRKVHLGVEVDLPILSLRAGLNEGYVTYGVGFNLGFMRFDIASYGVEMGVYPGQFEDRRYVLDFSMGFGFDPSFSFFGGSSSSSNGGSGGRRALKQRR